MFSDDSDFGQDIFGKNLNFQIYDITLDNDEENPLEFIFSNPLGQSDNKILDTDNIHILENYTSNQNLGFTFLILGLLNSKILTPLNSVWIKFGEYLGKFISPIIMMFIFFIIITPIGFILKILGKDILNLKFTDKSSYWLKRAKNIGSMNKQF